MKNRISPAKPDDSKQMLKIMESSGAAGSFELIYTRRPNPYLSYMAESDRVRIGVCKNDGGLIEYQAASILHSHFINGKTMNASYITGIKKRDGCRSFDWMHLSKYLSFEDSEIFFCSFLKSNESGKSIFLKHRRYLPDLIKFCDYRTFIFSPKQLAIKKSNKYVFRRMKGEDKAAVTEFLNEQGKEYNFSVFIQDIETQFCGLSVNDCYILEDGDNGKIAAFGALWDRTAYKQYIIKKYSFPLNFLKRVPYLTKAAGYFPLPDEDVPFRFPIISFFYSRDNNADYYESFLNEICIEASRKYEIAAIGMDLRNPNIHFFNSIKNISFDSSIYYLSYNPDIAVDLDKMSCIECALL